MNYELWLDESGKFEDDNIKDKSYKEGSLVGGVLIEKEFVDRKKIESILDCAIHACELEKDKYGEVVLPKLKSLINIGATLIVFHNKYKEKVISSDTTYINVLTEGIINLLKKLLINNDKVKLDIYYATRKAMDSTKGIIKNEQYIDRIKEKIELLKIKEGISRDKFQYEFIPVRANDKNVTKYYTNESLNLRKVDLSDLVCNTYLTRNSSKFTVEEKKEIEKLYDEEFIFEVLSAYEDNTIEKLLIDENYAEVISEYIFMDEVIRKRNNKKIIDVLLKVEESLLGYSFDLLVKKITIIIKNYRDNIKNMEVLEILENEIINQLDQDKVIVKKLKLAIKILILEVANHLGDTKQEDKALEEAKKIVSKIGFIEENRELIIKLLNRAAVAMINSFDFDNAIKITNNMISEMKELVELLAYCEKLILGDSSEISKKSDGLAKLYGTNVQAYIFKLINENDDYYKKAVENSDNSIEFFLRDADKNRQKEYRSNIECEVYNYKAAINYLGESLGLYNSSIDEIMKSIEEKDRNLFSIYHYLRILGKASLNNDSIADELYKEWNKSKIKEDYLLDTIKEKNIKDPYPFNLCMAKLGQYYFYSGSKNAGLNYMNEAIKLSKVNKVSYTNKGIGIYLIIIKLTMLLKEFNEKRDSKIIMEEKKNLMRELDSFLKETEGLVINKHFSELKNNIINANLETNINIQYKKYLKLANSLSY